MWCNKNGKPIDSNREVAIVHDLCIMLPEPPRPPTRPPKDNTLSYNGAEKRKPGALAGAFRLVLDTPILALHRAHAQVRDDKS